MALKVLLTAFAIFHAINAQQHEIPACLSICMSGVGIFNQCVDNALHKLTPCFIRGCPDTRASQGLIAALDVSFSPKAEVSCQQAYGPSIADKESSSVTLPLNGSCVTSPYDFKSYLPHGVEGYDGIHGCKIMVFSQEDCLGQTASSDLGKMSNERCVVDGGRSARLACEDDYSAAAAYIQASCGKAGYPNGSGQTITFGPGTAAFPPIWSTTDTDTTPSTEPAASTTADATGTGLTSSDGDTSSTYTSPSATGTGLTSSDGDTSSTYTLPSAPGPVSINFTLSDNSTSPTTASQNSTQTSLSSPDSQNATSSYSLTLTRTPTATSTPLPPYTGLAAACLHCGAQMGFALGLVGVGFAAFL